MKSNGRMILFTLILVVLATACKFFFGPELAWSGFSPVIAIALFAGFMLKKKDISFLMPLLALFISDVAIQVLYETGQFPYEGFYTGQWKNYLVILSATVIGWLFKGRTNAGLAGGTIAAPTLYFLVSNFMVWQASAEVVYPNSFSGLMICYEAGLPFYRNSLIATVLFLPVIMVLYNYMTARKARLTLA